MEPGRDVHLSGRVLAREVSDASGMPVPDALACQIAMAD